MKILAKILQTVLVIVIPFTLLMTSIRILLTPLTINIQYQLSNVPADSYGFTPQERTQYAKLAVSYLTNKKDIKFLSDQVFPNQQSLYNERELSHMQDVKILVLAAISVWLWSIVFLLAVGLLSWWVKQLPGFWRAIRDGGLATLALIFTILLGVSINFDAVFTLFHRIFFTGDTWLFFYSDTLIRLFPMEFWLNLFIAMGVFAILFSILFIIFGQRFSKRKGE